jgi:pyruvate/2-oxoglutarate dehydrogenase complex dihydrolipoamide acyltransferase (E2) component
MPFSHQLKFPPLNNSAVTARLDGWRQKPLAFLERGDPLADISIEGTAYTLCVDFPCAFSSVIAHPGDVVNTGDVIAACAAEGEDLPYSRESLVIRAI